MTLSPPGQPAVEEALEEVALCRERLRERDFVAGDHLQLDRRTELADDDVVIVFSAGEDDALARHLLRQEREESVRLCECVLDGGEQEVEQIAEQDQLVHALERVADPATGPLMLKQRLSGPSTEVRIGDDQCAYCGVLSGLEPAFGLGALRARSETLPRRSETAESCPSGRRGAPSARIASVACCIHSPASGPSP